MTLRVVAEANQIPLDGIEVAIDAKRTARVMESKNSWERQLRISKMRRQIRVKGALSADQRDLLLKGAEYCPVDNSLTTPVEIETTIELMPK